MSEPSSKKSTIYIDAEDEITAVIEKVRTASGSVVALVPPKRAAALQSVVNLKLLQRAAKSAKKNIVLVTSDLSLLPLAGMVRMHIAKTPASKPEIPPAPMARQPINHEADVVESGEDPAIDPSQSVGELAQKANVSKADGDDLPPVELAMPSLAASKASKKDAGKRAKKQAVDKPNKKLKVPNFSKFRNKMFLVAGGLIILIVLFVLATVVMPTAHITIKTDTSSVTVDLDLTASTAATGVDPETKTVPAIAKELKKSDSEKVPATGQRDDGTKASGTMTLTNCTGNAVTVPSGTRLDSGDVGFVTRSSVSLDAGNFDISGDCKDTGSHVGSTNVVAAANGDKYNVGAQSYHVAGVSGDVRGYGSTMSGGTSKIVKIVVQADVDSAKQKVMDRMKADAEKELNGLFRQSDTIAIKESMQASEPIVVASPAVKAEGNEVSVNVTVTYTEMGVKKDDVQKLVEAAAKDQIDTSKQTIQDSGIDSAVFRVGSVAADSVAFQLQSIVTAGPQLDTEAIKQDIAGQKRGETTTRIMNRPGIKDVEVKYSPFWVYSTPKNPSHIKIVFEKADGQQ